MNGVSLSSLVGSYVYIGFTQKIVIAGFEPPGPTKLIFVKLTGIEDHGIFFEHNKFPLTNKKTGMVELKQTQVFIPYDKIAHISSFPSIESSDDYLPTKEPVNFMR